MRVGLVVTGGFDRTGRERVVPALLAFVDALARRNETHVFALRHYREPCVYMLRGATVHDLGRVDGMRRRRPVAPGAPAVGCNRTHRSIPTCRSAYWAVPAGVVATRVARALAIPSIVTFDSGEFVSLPDIGYGLQRRWIDRRAVAATIRSATRATVLHRVHGSTCECPRSARPARAAGHRPGVIFRASIGWMASPWRLLHVASLNRVKDHAMLLQAMARVVRTMPSVHLDIVGEDTLGGRVQRLCRALDLDTYVSFHGFQPTDVLASFYARAHLHVVSSRHEAAGVVCLKRRAPSTLRSALRLATSPTGWTIESVAVPVGDSEALAAAIVALLADARQANSSGGGGSIVGAGTLSGLDGATIRGDLC